MKSQGLLENVCRVLWRLPLSNNPSNMLFRSNYVWTEMDKYGNGFWTSFQRRTHCKRKHFLVLAQKNYVEVNIYQFLLNS